MWRWIRTVMFRAPPGAPLLRTVFEPSGDPYRENLGAARMERTVDPAPLPQLCSALAEARLSFRERWHGFDLVGRSRARVMKVRVQDPERVIPSDMICGSDAPELLLDLALALVPIFGPMLVDVRFAGTMFIDGRRDRRALGEEAAQRLQGISRRVATRAPISFPILVDLARRMRQQR